MSGGLGVPLLLYFFFTLLFFSLLLSLLSALCSLSPLLWDFLSLRSVQLPSHFCWSVFGCSKTSHPFSKLRRRAAPTSRRRCPSPPTTPLPQPRRRGNGNRRELSSRSPGLGTYPRRANPTAWAWSCGHRLPFRAPHRTRCGVR